MQNVQNRSSQINHNSAPVGGQASVGTFGYSSFTAPATAPTLAPNGAKSPARHRGDDQPRRIGGLTYSQRAVRIRSMVAVAAIASRKGQTPAAPVPVPAPVQPESARVAAEFVRLCKAKPAPAGWSAVQYEAWLDERYAEAVAAQDAQAAEFDGYGLARPSTPAMQRACQEAGARDNRDWQELAELAACPEWDRPVALD